VELGLERADAADMSSSISTFDSHHLNSASSASESPPGPQTPPAAHRIFQHDLGNGRGTLNRPGTDNFESLEELLRAAGYKETRIYSPEADREERGPFSGFDVGAVKDGVGALVGFLSGIVGGAPRPAEAVGPRPRMRAPSPPPSPSPFSNNRVVRRRQSRSDDLSDEDPTPRSKARTHLQPSRPGIRHNHSAHFLDDTSNSGIASPRALRPHGHLRHMTSTQSMPPTRPSSTPVGLHLRDPEGTLPGRPGSVVHTLRGILASDTVERREREQRLPTPLFLTTDPYASDGAPLPRRGPLPTLRQSRSTLSQVSVRRTVTKGKGKSGLREAGGWNESVRRHPLLAVERGRTGRCGDTELCTTMVLCRSLPGSRAGSQVRGSSKGKRKEERVPSLARTCVEGDLWERRWGADGSDNDDDDDDDDEEPDLAHILQHPKRQNSIKSLRKHLGVRRPSVARTRRQILDDEFGGGFRSCDDG